MHHQVEGTKARLARSRIRCPKAGVLRGHPPAALHLGRKASRCLAVVTFPPRSLRLDQFRMDTGGRLSRSERAIEARRSQRRAAPGSDLLNSFDPLVHICA